MRHYEVMVILDAALDDDAVRAAVGKATESITSAGGVVDRIDRWGRRRFAYEVHHRSEGYYVLIEARAEPRALAQLDRVLGLSDEVIRHKVIKVPPEVAAKAVNPPGQEGSREATTHANGAEETCPTETT